MGRYCACGAKITAIKVDPDKCQCDWKDWVTFGEDGILPHPSENGIYEVRYGCNGGDHFEGEMRFQKVPYRIESTMYSDKKHPIHWDKESWDDYYVYAWKKKITGERIE